MYRKIPIATTTQARAADLNSAVPSLLLMENAAKATVQVISRLLDQRLSLQSQSPKFLVVCGPGNNGGDGLAIARLLHATFEADIKIFLVAGRPGYKDDALVNLRLAEKILDSSVWVENVEMLKKHLAEVDIVVDAIFGSGLSKEISVGSVYYDVIGMVNQQSAAIVVAVDIPSGVDGNSGQQLGTCVHADVTVTYGCIKPGNLFSQHAGELFFDSISIPEIQDISAHLFEPNSVSLPPRPIHSDKFTFGQALFIAGSGNYLGAPLFAALAFLKAGGGYSRLLTPRRCAEIAATRAPEVVMHATDADHLNFVDIENNAKIFERCDCFVVGPGLGLHRDTEQAVESFFVRAQNLRAPVVVDGDGLTILGRLLARNPDISRSLGSRLVLTPHVVELAKLVEDERGNLAREPMLGVQKAMSLSERLGGATIVVKNAPSFVVTHGHMTLAVQSGNSALATAGTGDVLAGVIAAVLCCGSERHHSVATAAWIHGKAGEVAGDRRGCDGVTASDVLEAVPEAVRILRSGNFRHHKVFRV